ncbi:MAG: TonB family protein [Acidobacteriota bacterium]|nr:TonB family protein [Acidobacteriota bacterium]
MTNRAFQRALYWSAGVHAALLLLFIVNPSLPKSAPKGEIRYVNLGLGGGGGGGTGGGGGGSRPPEETLAETPLPKPQLRDLTTALKAEAEPESSLRYPTSKTKAKPSRAKKPAPEKTTSVSRPDPDAKTGAKTGATTAAGGRTSGGGGGGVLTIGAGGPGFGEGSGLGGYGDQIGMGDFPYTYYLQNIQDRISGRWFQSLVDPGVAGTYRTAVYFRIFRNGTISRVEVKEPSGLRALDMSAQRAVTDASPFPPLPADYDEEYLGIILIFEHTK